ncbi:MAG: MarC family protein [Thermoguttaceae bacterium]
MNHWTDRIQYVTAIFVILNPLGCLPIFLSITRGQTDRRRNRTGTTAAMTVALVLVTSILAGDKVLRVFGINLPCFEVGGGILVLLMAVSMLHARHSRLSQTPEERRVADERESVGVVPLGMPLLAGPGSISTAIIYANKATDWFDTGFLIMTSILAAGTVWIVFRLGKPVGKALGPTGINILTRLMGLVLAAVAVKFITDGLLQLLPGLAAG